MKYEIWQLGESEEASKMLFISYEHNVKTNRIPRKELYEKVYEQTFPPHTSRLQSNTDLTYYILDSLYVKFNNSESKPSDFRGHSLSVSDVVILIDEKTDLSVAFYCDSFGWHKLNEF